MRPFRDTLSRRLSCPELGTRIRDSVGVYKLEEEGVRLFTRVEGDYFTVLGLPLLELLAYLTLRGVIDG